MTKNDENYISRIKSISESVRIYLQFEESLKNSSVIKSQNMIIEQTEKISQMMRNVKKRMDEFDLFFREYGFKFEELNQSSNFRDISFIFIFFLIDEIKKYDNNFLKLYENEFLGHEFFKFRDEIVMQGIKKFNEKDYNSSILLILTQFEGIVWDYGIHKNILRYDESKGKHKNIETNKIIYFNKAYKILFSEFEEGFKSLITSNVYSRVFRHEIVHGKVTDYGTSKNNFLILFVFFMTAYYIKYELEEQ